MLRVLLLIVSLLSFINCEIHRARGPPKSLLSRKLHTPRSTWPPGPALPGKAGALPPSPPGEAYFEDEEDQEWLDKEFSIDKEHVVENHSTETWVYSLISAALVGLSGIFPLLVIPIEAGKALKHGAPAARLKLLLSFAVGSLLGDVFLHLLPEAWAGMTKHQSLKSIGLWVLFGLCLFLVIEKIFPEEEDEEDDDEENEIEENKQTQQKCNGTTLDKEEKEPDLINGHLKNGYTNGHLQNGHLKNGHLTNGHLKNGFTNGYLSNGHANGISKENLTSLLNGPLTKKEEKHINPSAASKDTKLSEKSHIKTSGWLNLLANVIDNFTHGLAVAGSYCISTKVGVLTTFAILLHEIPHEIGDFAILLKSGFDRWKAAKAQLITASGGMLGAICALLADSVKEAGDKSAWVLPFTSGGFIYIALVTIVPDLMKENNPRESMKQVLLLCCGIAVMALVTLLFD